MTRLGDLVFGKVTALRTLNLVYGIFINPLGSRVRLLTVREYHCFGIIRNKHLSDSRWQHLWTSAVLAVTIKIITEEILLLN